jgi:hypothetical protein
MEKVILSLKSKLVLKTKMDVKFKQKFDKSTFSAKVQNMSFEKTVLSNKLSEEKIATLSCSTGNFYKVQNFALNMKYCDAKLMAKEYEITNPVILNNLTEFRDMMKVYIKLYNLKYNDYLDVSEDNAYFLLGRFQSEITALEQLQKMKVENLFDDETIYLLENNY